MKSEDRTPRRHPAHPSPVERHNTPIILMVSVTACKRRQILANEDVVSALVEAWTNAKRWVVGNYVVMPEHLHVFCSPAAWPRDTVQSWVAYWKRLAGQLNPTLKGAFVYGCWDTQMRNQDHYARKLEYVAMNPVRRKLVSRPDQWPFRGRLVGLPW